MHAVRKTYLSLELSRALAHEFPVGDPFGGPAYREKNMPVVALAGMAASGAAIVSAGGFVAAGLATSMAFIGSALSFVGQISGNEKLAKIGGIVGLGGGITNIAQNWGSISESLSGAAETASTAAEAAEAGSGSIASNIADTGGASHGLAEAGMEAAKGGLDNGGLISNAMSESSALGDAPMSGSWSGNEANNWSYDAPALNGLQQDAPSVFSGSSPIASPGAAQAPTAMGDAPMAGGTTSAVPEVKAADIDKYLASSKAMKATNFSDWIKQNKEMMDIGNKVLGGVGDYLAKSEAAKLQQEAYLAAQQNNFDRADELMRRYSDSIKNLASRDVMKDGANIYSTPNGQNVQYGVINRAATWAPRQV